MKAFSIFGIFLSISGILVSIVNWILFTEQIPGNNSKSINPSNGWTVIEFPGSLEHHEHSISMLIILCVIFLFFLVYSIFSLFSRSLTQK